MTRYTLTLQASPEPGDPEGVHRLRALLKRMLRAYRLRCVNVEPAPAELAIEPIADVGARNDRKPVPTGMAAAEDRPPSKPTPK